MTHPSIPAGWVGNAIAARDGVELVTFEIPRQASSCSAQGEPVVLGLHGFAADSIVTWSRARVIESLARSGFRIVLLDLRGHGRSDKPIEISSYAMSHLVSDVIDVLDAYNIGRAFIVGYSLGSVISLRLASDTAYRDRVQAVVAGGAGGHLLPGGQFYGSERVAAAMEASNIAAVADPNARAYRRFAEATGADLRALALIQRSLLDGVYIDLSSIPVPTLVVAGKDDFVAGSPEELARRIPRGEWLQVPGNHMNALLNKSFADGVIGFLNNLVTSNYQ